MTLSLLFLFFCFSTGPLSLATASTEITRTPWQYYRTNQAVTNPSSIQTHGHISEYAAASVPSQDAAGWTYCSVSSSFCKDPTNLSVASRSILTGCWSRLDFSYFQTIANVPVGVTVSDFKISFTTMDDGARISIYNARYPTGLVVDGSYVFLGQTATVNLASYIVTGDNRIVITQVDDCAVENNIAAQVSFNGLFVAPTCSSTQCTSSSWSTTQGRCVDSPKADGTTCDDANACTQSDTCQSGVCTGSSPVICAALDQCHIAGTCDINTGVCSNPKRFDGDSCNDENACTQTDTCSNGQCIGHHQVTCSALDQCHVAGTCDINTGVCSNPACNDGTTCDDGDACTQTDACQSGVCTGSNPVICTALDQCHVAGTCDPTTGVCPDPEKSDGSACDDENACTLTDTCLYGYCLGEDPVNCPASDECHVEGTCDPTTGVCSNPTRGDGASCDDEDACTQTDTCQSGVCTGSNPVICTALDQCHVAGTCDTVTGLCYNPSSDDGTVCNDRNACTQTDSCQSGVCTGFDPVACSALDQCHSVGTCDPSSGQCSNPLRPDGDGCNDGNDCTQTDTCQSGTCVGTGQLCCSCSGKCGKCVMNCGNEYQTVLSFFHVTGTQSAVSASGGGGRQCPGTSVCCVPRDQSHVSFKNGACVVS